MQHFRGGVGERGSIWLTNSLVETTGLSRCCLSLKSFLLLYSKSVVGDLFQDGREVSALEFGVVAGWLPVFAGAAQLLAATVQLLLMFEELRVRVLTALL